MEKILLAMDAKNVNTQAIDFACYLARLTNSRLTGIFLEDLLSDEKPAIRENAELQNVCRYGPVSREMVTTVVEGNIAQFRQSCECRGIVPKVHRDRGIPLYEVIQESRFADLLVIDAETSFARNREAVPGRFVKDVLQEAECPVIIAPYSFHSVDEIYFAYNGSASSVFAIRQFTYLFPEWRQKKITVINVRDHEENTIEDQFKMKEWLGQHYTDVEFKVLKGDASDQLFGYLLEKTNAMVIIGAYGRSMLSRFFRHSHAHLLVKSVNLPLFIAHH